MAEPVIIRNRPFWARVLTVFWLAEIALALVFWAIALAWSMAGDVGLGAILACGGLVLLAAGAPMAALSWRIARLAGAAIAMTDSGLRDRRIADILIPWKAITWTTVFNGRTYSLQFDAAEPHAAALRRHWDQRLMGRYNRLFGFPEFTVVTLGTGEGVARLAELMNAYRPRRA